MTEETLFYEGSGVDTSLAHEELILLILHIQGEAWREEIKTEGGGGGDRDRGRQKEGGRERQTETDRQTEGQRERQREPELQNTIFRGV